MRTLPPIACATIACVLVLAACSATPRQTAVTPVRGPSGVVRATPNVPDFAIRPYEPFSRAAVLAIATREWRLFGQPVDDDPPGTRPPPLPEDKPERQEGLWQRVGEYWWESQDLDTPQAAWTGKDDAFGVEFPASDDGEYAWSAAFVSYVMRIAGAGGRFPYAPSHNTYIDAAWRQAQGQETGWVVTASPIDAYAPVAGDLICESRTQRPLRYTDLPKGGFPSHCDIVVRADPGQLTVLGGNVDDAVTMKHIPTLPDGRLGETANAPLDTRYPWFVVLRVSYDSVTSALP